MKRYNIWRLKKNAQKKYDIDIEKLDDESKLDDFDEDDTVYNLKNIRYHLKYVFDTIVKNKYIESEITQPIGERFLKNYINKFIYEMEEIREGINEIKQKHNYRKDADFKKELSDFLEKDKNIVVLNKIAESKLLYALNFIRNFLKNRLPLYQLDENGDPIEYNREESPNTKEKQQKQTIHYDMIENSRLLVVKKPIQQKYNPIPNYLTYDILEFHYKKMAWLPFYSNITFVFLKFDSKDVFNFFKNKEWINTISEYKSEIGYDLYKVNYLFFKDCSKFKNKKFNTTLNGIVFDFDNKKDIFYQMYFEKDDGSLILYDNDMFLCENNYIKNIQSKLKSFDLEIFKKETCDTKSFKIMSVILQEYFKNYTDKEIFDFLKNFQDKNNEDLIDSISDILKVNKRISSLLENVSFFHKLEMKKYNLDSLIYLTSEEKLFEFFYNDHISTNVKNIMLQKLEEHKQKIKMEIYNIFANYFDPSIIFEKKPTFKKISFTKEKDLFPNIKLTDWKHLCVNKEEIAEYENYELTFFKQPNKTEIYCYKISDLLKNFENGNYFNKYTNENFPIDFVSKVKRTYAKDFLEKIEDQQEELEFVNELFDKLKLNHIQEDFLNFFTDEINILISEMKKNTLCYQCKNAILNNHINVVVNDRMETFCSINCIEKI